MTFDEEIEAQIRAIIEPSAPHWPYGAGEDLVRAFVLMMEAAREDEREACAKVAETTYAKDAFHWELGTAVAKRIRERGTVPSYEDKKEKEENPRLHHRQGGIGE